MSEILRKIRVPLESGEIRELDIPAPSLLDHLGHLKFKWCTFAEYGAISFPDSETLYFIHAGSRLLKVMLGSSTLMVCEPNRIEYIPQQGFAPRACNFGFDLGGSITPAGYPLEFINQNLFEDGRFLNSISLVDVSYLRVVCYIPSSRLRMSSSADVVDLTALDTTRIKDMTGMCNFGRVTELDVSGFNTINATSMKSMFGGCRQLKKLDVGRFDTSKAKTFSSMFENCESLESLNVLRWNLNNCTDVNHMFRNCSSLKTIDLTWSNTHHITTFEGMFENCAALKSIDMRCFDTTAVTDKYAYNGMFRDCEALESLDIANFNFKYNTCPLVDIFKGCTSLRNLTFGKNYRDFTLDLGDCPLTHTSAMSVINGLTQSIKKPQLIFSAETYDTLTDEELALALSLGYDVCRR